MPHCITLQPSGTAFQVEEGETILAAAVRHGVAMAYSCREGYCGSCKSRLLDGQVSHGAYRHSALPDADVQEGFMLPCVAQPRTDCLLQARSVEPAAAVVRKLPIRVAGIQRAAPDVMVVHLQLPANQDFPFRAGQYVDVTLRDGTRRSYSMATAPHLLGSPPVIELHVRHMLGGQFTDQVFASLRERDILRMEGPLGTFYLREDSRRPIVFLASGTGFAPIRAILQRMQDLGDDRPAVLYWGGRRREDLYLHDWCLRAELAMPGLRYVPVLSDAAPDDGWTGRTGFIHRAVMEDCPDLSDHEVYACGAPVVVESARRDFVLQCALPVEHFHADSFITAADRRSAGAPASLSKQRDADSQIPAFTSQATIPKSRGTRDHA